MIRRRGIMKGIIFSLLADSEEPKGYAGIVSSSDFAGFYGDEENVSAVF